MHRLMNRLTDRWAYDRERIPICLCRWQKRSCTFYITDGDTCLCTQTHRGSMSLNIRHHKNTVVYHIITRLLSFQISQEICNEQTGILDILLVQALDLIEAIYLHFSEASELAHWKSVAKMKTFTNTMLLQSKKSQHSTFKLKPWTGIHSQKALCQTSRNSKTWHILFAKF